MDEEIIFFLFLLEISLKDQIDNIWLLTKFCQLGASCNKQGKLIGHKNSAYVKLKGKHTFGAESTDVDIFL